MRKRGAPARGTNDETQLHLLARLTLALSLAPDAFLLRQYCLLACERRSACLHLGGTRTVLHFVMDAWCHK